jgi:hypothetical protein
MGHSFNLQNNNAITCFAFLDIHNACKAVVGEFELNMLIEGHIFEEPQQWNFQYP